MVPPGSTPDSSGVPGQGKDDASLKAIATHRILYASQYGAKNGKNITDALMALSADANYLKSNFRIVIDVEAAEIFYQKVNNKPSSSEPYFIPAGNIIELTDCSEFTIDFTGSVLITKAGLRFGAFDPLTGIPSSIQTVDPAWAAHVGRLVYLTRCKNYQIINVNAEGNNEKLILGGGWGDKDIQCTHTGTSENDCFNGVSTGTHCNYFGLDGTYIGSTGTGSRITHINPVCHYNGRQGLSITGSDHITLINPDYSYTGRGAVSSSPRAGIDVEPNGNYWSVGIHIINPKLINNMGAGILTVNGKAIIVDGGEIVSDGACFYCAENPTEITFNDTKFYGCIRIAKGRRIVFNNPLISDAERYDVRPALSAPLIQNLGPNVIIRDGKIFSRLNNLFVDGGKIYDTTFILRAGKPEAKTRAAYFRPALARDVTFIQQYVDDSLVRPDGEHTYIDTGEISSQVWQGDSRVNGSSLAIGGRSGMVNSLIATVKPAEI